VEQIHLPDDSLFRSAFLCAGHGMGIVDRDGRFIAVNPALCAIVGRAAEDLHCLRFQDITHPDDLPRDIEKLRQLIAGEIPSYAIEKRYLAPDGTTVPIQLNVGVLRGADGAHEYFIAHIIDLTDHKRALNEVAGARDKREAACVKLIKTIAGVVEKGDPHTAGHQHNVAEIARCIAEALGLPRDLARSARLGALLHDLGKVSVPAQLLSKPGPLSEHEWQLIREHPVVGHDILSRADVPWPVATIARQHHERMDGSGYPLGLRGTEICLEARIVAVADVYESIASFRPYRQAHGWRQAVEELEGKGGVLYDSDVALACVARARDLEANSSDALARAFHIDD
jgi:PAS domain S-box-containing protein/putative nucleotidyltransferase with HDIG domain